MILARHTGQIHATIPAQLLHHGPNLGPSSFGLNRTTLQSGDPTVKKSQIPGSPASYKQYKVYFVNNFGHRDPGRKIRNCSIKEYSFSREWPPPFPAKIALPGPIANHPTQPCSPKKERTYSLHVSLALYIRRHFTRFNPLDFRIPPCNLLFQVSHPYFHVIPGDCRLFLPFSFTHKRNFSIALSLESKFL